VEKTGRRDPIEDRIVPCASLEIIQQQAGEN